MPYQSDKTPEQLDHESRTKSADRVNKAAAYLEQVIRKRNTNKEIKQHLSEVVLDLRACAKAVGPGGQ